MKVKVVVHTGVTEEGSFVPGDKIEIRDAKGQEWIKRGWAIDYSEKKPEPKKPEPEPEPERAVIETPEDNSGVAERETATIKRRKK